MAMTFGVFQDAYTQQQVIHGPRSATGVIGTTMNGVMYLSMPFLSALLERSPRWSAWKRRVAVAGTLISAAAFFVSSWSTEVWHLIVLQGLLAALGNAMLYVPTTLWLDEWFREGNSATAYGVQFSIKNIIGTAGPFLMQSLLQNLGFRNALRVWAGIVLAVGLGGILITPQPQQRPSTHNRRPQMMPWSFLKHRTFYIYAIANAAFSSGYGLPQTYLPAYASQLLRLSASESTAMIAMFNAPGIISSTGFGLLSDKLHVSGPTNTLISALGSALCVFLLWAIKSNTLPGLLIAFAVGYGFFASGYSSTWGGWIKDLEREAAEHNEAISSGMIYGFMNGARGIGYVAGGLSGVELLKLGPVIGDRGWALGTDYGALILFTGVSSVLGGWGSVWKGCRGGR
jgi:MFS family permease